MATRAKRPSGRWVGLLAALYLMAALLPIPVMAAEPLDSATSAAPTNVAEAGPVPDPSAVPTRAPASVPEPAPAPTPTPGSAATGAPDATPAPSPVVSAPPASPEPGPAPDPSGGPAPHSDATAAPTPPVPTAAPAAAATIRYLVTMRTGSTTAVRAAVLASVGGELDDWIPELRIAAIRLDAATAALDAAALAADPTVLRIERDRSRELEATPSDPRYPDQWSLPVIGWGAIPDRPAPTDEVVVAILDTGVDATHPDLAGRLLPGLSFVDGQPADTDIHGHGTALAGIVSAAIDNDIGIAGIGGEAVRVLPITVLAPDGTGQDGAVIAGIVAAVDSGADVILMAFSAPGYSAALQAAIDYAWANDVVLVAANGNDGTTDATYPAGDRAVMGIASTDRVDRLARDSNHGPQTFLAAPGVDILSTAAGADRDPETDDEYGSVSGTSAAAAAVAGAAAVLRGLDPAATNAVVVGRVARSAARVGTRSETGNGRLDLARAASDTGTDPVTPSGVAGSAEGGPFVGPYTAASTSTDCFRSLASGNWGTVTTWESAPIAGGCVTWSTANLAPTSAASTITIRNTHVVTVAASVTADQVVVDAAGELVLNSGFTLTVANGTGTDLSVTGTFRSAGTVTINVGATIVVNNGGRYKHAWTTADGVIPTATWSAGSTIEIVGYTSPPGGGGSNIGYGQSFWDFEWNTPNQTTANFSLGGYLGSVNGNMTVTSTGTGALALGNNAAGDLAVSGDYSQTGGTLRGTLGTGVRAMSVAGDFSLSSGTFDFGSSAASVTLSVAGDFTHSGGTLTETGTSTTSGSTFDGSGVQTYTSGGTVSNDVDFTVISGATLQMAATTTTLTGGGAFTLSSGATLGITAANGITSSGASGNVQTNVRTYSAGANYTYNGSAAQATGTGLPATVNDLTVANTGPANVTLTNAATTVNGALALTSGDLSTGSGANVLTLAAAATCSGTTDVISDASATGGVRRTTIGLATMRCFGHPQNQITITSGTAPSAITIKLVKSVPAAKADAITRTHTITPTGGVGYAATVRLHYLEAELNGNTESGLHLWRLSGSWTDQDPSGTSTTRDTTANWVQQSGIATFSDWTLAGPANVAPVLTASGGTTAHTENVPVVIDAGITLTDADDTNIDSGQVLINSGYLPEDVLLFTDQNGISGSYSGGILTLTGVATKAFWQTALRSITYNDTSNTPGTGNRSVAFLVNDGTADSNFVTKVVSVAAVNDAPVNSVPVTQTTHVNTPEVFSTGNGSLISTSDVDAAAASVQVQLVSTNGTSTLSGITGLTFSVGDGTADATMTFTGTVAAVNSALSGLSFNPTASFSGTATLQIVTNDQGNSPSGALTDSDTVSITVVLNTAPTAVADNYSVNEDMLLIVAVGTGVRVNDTDPQSDPLTALLVSDVANGDLALSADGSFTYLPGANFNGTDSFTYKANDGTLDSNVATVIITVTADNDAPVNSRPAVDDTSRNVTLVFSSGNGNLVSIGDVDAGGSTVQVQLTATNGTITLPVLTNLTFSVGDGTADPTMTFTGTLANINLRLAGMNFIPTTSFTGAATLQIVTSDLGNTGTGGALTDTDTVAITVYALGIFTANGDIGTAGDPGTAGSSSYSAGTYTVAGGGSDIWNNADHMQFLYRSMTGDGRLTARVVSQTQTPTTSAPAKAGVMFRSTLAAGSIHGMVDPMKSNGSEFHWRLTTNGPSGATTGTAGIAAPYWVRLTRINDVVTGERSPDGTNWTQQGSSQTIALGATIFVGLAVSAVDNTKLNTATFDNVSFDATGPTADFSTPDEGATYPQAATSYTIAWTESDGGGIGVGTRSLQRWKGSPSGGSCAATAWSTDGAAVATVSSINQTGLIAGTCYRWVQTLTDYAGNQGSDTSGAVLVDTSAPAQPNVTGSGTNVYQSGPNSAIYFKSGITGTIALSSSSTDPTSGINKHNYGALSAGTGWTYASGDVAGNPAGKNATWGATSSTTNVTLTPYNGALTAGTTQTVTLTADSTAPGISAFTPSTNATQTSTTVTPTWTETEAGSGVASRSLQRTTGAQSPAGSCLTTSWANDGAAVNVASGVAQTGLAVGSCYQWTLTVSDRVGNTSGVSTSSWILVVTASPTVTATVAALAYVENGTTIIDAGITAGDPDSVNLASATVTMTTNYVNGQDTLAFVSQNGITGSWTAATGVLALTGSATVANYQTALRSITYTNNSNYPVATARTVTFVVNDGGTASNTASRQITITAVNDPPAGSGGTLTINEDAPYTFATADFGFYDTPDNGLHALLAVKVTTLPASGTLTLNGSAVTAGQFVSAANITSGLLLYTPVANANGAFLTSFTFQVQDDGGTANGGVDLDASPNTLSFTVTAVNDAPLNTVPGSQSTTVNTATVFSTGNGNAVSIVDIDAGVASVQVALTATNGTLTLASLTGLTFTVGDGTADATMTFTGTLANANTALNGLTFTPTPAYAGSATVTIVTGDQGNTGTGGALSDTDAVTVTMTGSAPVATADAFTTNEDTTLAVPVTGAPYNGVLFNDTDAESDPLTAVLVANVATGTLSLATNGSFSYIPVANASGVVTFTYKANDGSADSNTVTVTITISAVNDAPVLTPTVAALAYTENGTTILDAGITATDVDTANLSSATVTMTTNYQSTQDTLAFVNQNGITGTWTAGTGVLALTGSATVANYQTALRSITYNNSSNAPNTSTRTVTFVASDGTASSITASRGITIGAVNDGPVNTVPGAQATVTDLAEVFSTGIGNPISVADADVGGSSLQVQLAGTNGTITLSGITGLTFTVGDGTADATMTFTGTLTNVNTALSGSRLTPTTSFNGTATLQIITNDQGNTGSGGALSDTDNVSITVEPIDLGIFTAHQDIGAPGVAGTANLSGGVYTVEGGGTLSGGGVTDQFQFIYRPMTGDGQLIARVVTVENTNILAKAGVIFRNTLAANSASVFQELRPAAGSASVFVFRSTAGGANGSAATSGIIPPYWVRMTRTGSAFKAERSADGVAWVQEGTTQTITMGATVYVGLGVTAQDNAKLATATFDNVSLNLAPTAVADTYSVDEDASLAPSAPGVLTNDTDPENGAMTAVLVANVSNGSLTLNADGSFSYTPTADYFGIDSFSYKANDGTFGSNTVTVTITVTANDGAFVSSAWPATFDGSRYITLTFPAYVPAGSAVTSATFRYEYRSELPGDTTCYYFEVYSGVTLIATHGSAGLPVSCNATASYASDAVALPEVDTVAEANGLSIKLFLKNSGGRASRHRIATLGVTSSLD